MATAWKHAGRAGLAAIAERRWRSDPLVVAAAKQALAAAGAPVGRIRADRNTLTIGEVQLRLGHDGRWWRFEKRSGRWDLSAPPADDPDDLWDRATDPG